MNFYVLYGSKITNHIRHIRKISINNHLIGSNYFIVLRTYSKILKLKLKAARTPTN